MQSGRHSCTWSDDVARLQPDLSVIGKGVAIGEPDRDASNTTREGLLAQFEKTVIVEPC